METIFVILAVALIYFSFRGEEFNPLFFLAGLFSLYLSYNNPQFITNKLILLIVVLISLIIVVDFRRKSLRLTRIPFICCIIIYFFFREKAETYITTNVLKYLPNNPYPLWFGIVIIIIGYFFILRFIRRRSTYGA